MSWDPIWEKIFKDKGDWGKYPPEELIRFMAKNYYQVKDRSVIKILDLGCGYGSASWYLAREGFSVSAIDGSKEIINKLKARLKKENLKVDTQVGEISHLDYPSDYFDAVVENVCLACNDIESTDTILKEVTRVLKTGGMFFSITPAADTWGVKTGIRKDKYSFLDLTEGPYAHMGILRTLDKKGVTETYGKYFNFKLDKLVRTVNNGQKKITTWIIEGVKK